MAANLPPRCESCLVATSGVVEEYGLPVARNCDGPSLGREDDDNTEIAYSQSAGITDIETPISAAGRLICTNVVLTKALRTLKERAEG